MLSTRLHTIAILSLATLMSCDRPPTAPPKADTTPPHQPALPSNRIAIDPAVRANLGITFTVAERRHIEETLRLPGRFEYLPSARHQYNTPIPGQVELLVKQFDKVQPGTPLYRIDAPAWRDTQKAIARANADIETAQATLDSLAPLKAALDQHEFTLLTARANWADRLEQLNDIREAGGGSAGALADARASIAETDAKLANLIERKAQLAATGATTTAQLRAANSHFDLLLASTAALLDTTVESLQEPVRTQQSTLPRWRTITDIYVNAMSPGIIDSIDVTNGAWVDSTAAVLTVTQPDKLRFHADGLQSDLGVLRNGLTARIVPPTPSASPRGVPLTDTMTGTLILGPGGDADGRTIDMYVTPETLLSWARPGVSAQLEVVTSSTSTPELAIPLAAIQRDGLTPVIFRRDSDNPNEAIRIEADLGLDDGRWVAVLSELADGDEVVLDGGFQLMLAMSGSIEKGGHFHADGTFHEGEH